MPANALLAACAAFLLAACRTTPAPEPERPNLGEVGAELMQPAVGATRMALAAGQRFVFPNLTGPAALPEYPPELLPLRLDPVVACADVVIGDDGLVREVLPRTEHCEGAGTSPHQPAFEAATREAVLGWEYAPALVCQAPAGFTGDDACTAEGMVETPTAVRLSYLFRFSQRDGVPEVERGASGSR
ncbi:hypothetical protein LDO26_05420 [Luteimonas sp. BDR2-5]|uniref:hypothetical protein n=1 Tax=Proluteimonas luteida TaxID=2878685 RepID=UPI001E4E3DA1|nr:hypothetical protein [Luteimonas sp. BDR2-5]MCD9027646.1 hypothetical protein [Luteimonas sp. BDR2-5]